MGDDQLWPHLSGVMAFYIDDRVQLKDTPAQLGDVLMIHEKAESTSQPIPEDLSKHKSVAHLELDDIFSNGLPRKGFLVIQWAYIGSTEAIAASEVKLFERPLYTGSIVKRDPRAAMAGIVTDTMSLCSLSPIHSYKVAIGQTIYGWSAELDPFIAEGYQPRKQPKDLEGVPLAALERVEQFEDGDLVIYGDWVGRISDIALAYTLLLPNNTVVELIGLPVLWDGMFVQLGDMFHTTEESQGKADGFAVGTIDR